MVASAPTGQDRAESVTRVPVECPVCHWRYFQEISLDDTLINSPAAEVIRAQLAAWLASRCPEHLGPIMKMSRN